MSSKKETIKIGAHEVSFGPMTIMRIEQRTGMTAGEILGYVQRKRSEILEKHESGDEHGAGVLSLVAMGNITLAMKFVGAALNVSDKVVEVDHGDDIISVFGKMISPFSRAVVRMTGSDPDANDLEGDEGDPGNASEGDDSSTSSPE